MYAYSSPPMYSFGGSERKDELATMSNFHAPGPGTYEQTREEITKQTSYSTWKVGTSKRPNMYSTAHPAIGPGSYNTSGDVVLKTSAKSFPKSKRGHSEFKGATAAGPASYLPKKITKAYPCFSFGYKTDGFIAATRSKTPGPGAYEFQAGFEEQDAGDGTEPKSAFTRTAPQAETFSRLADGHMHVPGPGSHFNPEIDNYNFRYFTPNWSFGKSYRDDLYNNEAKNVPGPGTYQLPGALKMKSGFTILGRHPIKANGTEVPAPNKYKQSIDPLRQTAPSFRIPQAPRKDLIEGSPGYPGPGAYNRDELGSSKGTRIGTSMRSNFTEAAKRNPGPGQYEVNGNIGNNSKYSMGVKPQAKKVNEVMPGPGEYEPFGSVYLEKNNGAIIGTSERPPLNNTAPTPGPGMYDTRTNIGGYKSKIGSSRRVPLAKVNDEPGPGYYNIPSAIGNVPKYQKPGFALEKKKTMGGDKDTSFRGIFG